MFDPALIAKAQTETSDINLPTAAMNDLFGAGLRLGSQRLQIPLPRRSRCVAILELYPDFSVSRSEKYFSGRISPANRQRTKVLCLTGNLE